MKTMYCFVLGMLVLLAACKKDSDDDGSPTTSSSLGYALKAPPCLLTNGYSIYGGVFFFYDGQKRLVKQSSNHDSSIAIFTYSGNTMLETITYKNEDGSTQTYSTLYFLNIAGLIDSSVEEYSGLSFAKVYQYNSQGYLIRTYERDASGSLRPISSYQYLNGNRIADYRISTDWQNQARDSVLEVSYTYHLNMNGAFDEWSAWTTRKGRGNKNEIKSMQIGNYSETRTYFLGANNLPSQIDVQTSDGDFSLNLAWKCN